MEILQDLSLTLCTWIAPYMSQVATALVSSVLFVYGGDIHAAIRKSLASQNFVVRLTLFVVICSCGYGLMAIGCAYLVRQGLLAIPRIWLMPFLIGLFLTIGFLAEEKKKM